MVDLCRRDLEESVVYSLFGDWEENPFVIDDWKDEIRKFDPYIIKNKPLQLVARAIKKMNELPEYENVLPTMDMVVAYVKLNAPKIVDVIFQAIIEAGSKTPLEIDLWRHTLDLLQKLDLKEQLKEIE